MIPGIVASGAVVAEPSPALWTPAEISTQLWFDAADAATVTLDTGAVSLWADKSGNARDVSQGTAANRPLYNAVQLNSLPVLTFGLTDGLRKTSASAGLLQDIGAASSYIVRRFTDISGSSSPVVVSVSNNVASTARLVNYCSEADDLERVGGIRTDAQAFAALSLGLTAANTWALVSGHWNYAAAQLNAYKNASQTLAPTAFQTAGNTSNTAPLTIGVGCWVDGTLPMKGNIAEVIVTHVIDTTQRELIEGYLAWKWGLQSLLPAPHPYKSAAPLL